MANVDWAAALQNRQANNPSSTPVADTFDSGALQDAYVARESARNQAAIDRPVESFQYGAKDALADVGQTIENVPGSMWQLAKDVTSPVWNAKEFWPGLGNLIEGGVQKLIPGENESEQYFDDAVDVYKDRYGSLEKAGDTIKNDPVGAFSDIIGVGGVLAPGKIGRSARAVSPTAPITNTPAATVRGVGAAANPERLYETSARFHPSLGQKKIDEMVDTGLREGIPVGDSGLAKTHKLVKDLNSQIDTLIDAADKSGKTFPRKMLYKYLKDARKNKGGVRTDAGRDLKQIDSYIGKLDRHLESIGKDRLTVRDLQDFKKSVTSEIYNDSGQLKSKTAVDEARKQTAKAAREGVEQALPEAHAINAREGALIQLRDGLEKVVPRQGGNNLLGLDTILKAGMGGATGGIGGAAVGAGLGILGKPPLKSRLAIAANKMRGDGPLSAYKNNTIGGEIMRQIAIEEARKNDPR